MTATTVQPSSERGRCRTRIGSDEAQKWARKLRLHNPYAKSILRAVANYMNEEGSAYPGIETLHLDTDIAEDTIVNRLRWCESIGAIALFKCWVDENGRRNHDGRGRTTSTEIRFLFDADLDDIEAKALGSAKPKVLRGAALASHQANEISPRPDGQLTDEISPRPDGQLNPVSPGLAPEQPPTRADRREELEPKKDSPLPPKGGDTQQQIADQESEAKPWPHAESWSRFEDAYSDPIGRQTFARHVWAALTDDERVLATKAAKGYVAYRRSQKKQTTPLNAHTFLKERDAWARYAALAPPDQKLSVPESRFVAVDSQEFRARQVLDVLHGYEPRQGKTITEKGNGCMVAGPEPGPELLALAQFDLFDRSQWFELWHDKPEHKHQLGAWRERIGDLSWKSVETGGVIEVLGNRYPRRERYSLVPCEWPPRKDGTLSTTGPPVAA